MHLKVMQPNVSFLFFSFYVYVLMSVPRKNRTCSFIYLRTKNEGGLLQNKILWNWFRKNAGSVMLRFRNPFPLHLFLNSYLNIDLVMIA